MSGISRCLWAILMTGLLAASGAFAQSAAEHLERAQRLYAEGKNRETVAACDLALAADPGLAEAHRRRGWALWKLGEYEPALLAFDRAIELEPENAMHPNGRANVLYSLGRFEEALADADRAVALKPDYGNALISRGLIHSALGDEEAARRDHLRATRVEPSNTLAYNNLGVSLKKLGDLRGALAAGDRALEIDPGYEPARRNRSSWRREAGDPDGAAADAVWLIEHQPESAFGYDLLGRARLRQDRYTDAVAAFERVVELEPENVAGHHMLGFARFNAGDFRGSERELSRALELDPDHVGALMDRGRTRRRLGDLDGALADYDRRLALLPDNALTHNNRGTIWMDRGEPELAKRDFETALRLDPETPDAADNLRTATRRIAAVAGGGTTVGATLPALPVRSHVGPWEPGPETTVLFNGVLDERWVPHSAAGGSFDSHARVVGGELRVDVPAGAAWGKVGLLSPQPLVWLDRFGDGAEAEVVFRFDPTGTTGFVLALAVPGWGGVAGNEPGNPHLAVSWLLDPETGSARVEVHRVPHRQDDFWRQTLTGEVPSEVRIRLRPGEATISSPGLFGHREAWNEAAAGQSFRVYAHSHAFTAHQPVRMALREIVLHRTFVPEQPPRPADGVAELPVTAWFEGRSDPRWQGVGVAGGVFERFARYQDGRLMVAVPAGNGWGKTGLLSQDPLVRLDEHCGRSPARIRVRMDPSRTSGAVLALSNRQVPDMWLDHVAWASVFQQADGTVRLGLHASPYQEWSRVVDVSWNGELELVVGDGFATVSIPGGPTIRGSGLPVGPGSQLYATLLSHSATENEPNQMALQWLGVDRLPPPGMTGAERWMLLDDDAFDPDEFLDELARPAAGPGGAVRAPGLGGG